MKQYDIYKNSRIALIGDIPKHWEVKKLKHFAKVNGRIGFRGYTTDDLVAEGNGAYTIGGKHIANCVLDLSSPDFISWEKYYESPEIMVKQGDILMAQRGSLGKVAVVRDKIKEATINPSLVLINGIAINNIFLYYFLISKSTTSYIELINTATAVPMISQNQIENIYAPVPPLNEQEKIANWLDWKVGQIDDIIAEKESIVADMQKYRQSLISETVTHGLNSNEPLRSSGIDLIGDIPESWNCLKLKRILSDESDNLKVGPFGSQLQGDDILREGDYWIYNQRTVLDNNFETTNAYVSKDKFENMSSFAVREKDILITTRGTIGKICQVPNNHAKGIIHPCIIKFRINEEMMDYKFLEFVFNDSNIVEQQIKISSNATTIDVIYGGTLKEIFLPVPTVKEQKEIVQFLASKTEQIDEIISGLTVQITDLRSYKSSLISEAVTGKIDLREVEIPETIKA